MSFLDFLIGWRHVWPHMKIFWFSANIGDKSPLSNHTRGEKNMHNICIKYLKIQNIFGVTVETYFIIVSYKFNMFQTPWKNKFNICALLQSNLPYKNIKYYYFKLINLCLERMCKLTTKTVFLFQSCKVAHLIKDKDKQLIFLIARLIKGPTKIPEEPP